MSLDDDLDYELDDWRPRHSDTRGYHRVSDMTNGGYSGNLAGSSNSMYLHAQNHNFLPSVREHVPPIQSEPVENDTERKARLLQETKKSIEKTEKKRLKKRKQKERKQREKLKEQLSCPKNEEVKEDCEQSKAEETRVNDKSTADAASVKEAASSTVTDSSSSSSEDESSDEGSETKNESDGSEELDFSSTFVSKAALIAKRKLEQKARTERREKKQTAVKEDTQTANIKVNQDQADYKKDTTTATSFPTYEDNVKISTEFAAIGNKFASTGDFGMAEKYFTHAIKYNPTEYKLFGNRSFCFEKMQDYEKALTDAELSLSMCPGWVKGFYRKGRALAGLKRYDEAIQAFLGVLKVDSSRADAAQELMRVQIIQLMEHGFSREQSTNALIIHGTVNEALRVLSKLNNRPGGNLTGTHPAHSPLTRPQVVNTTGVSPILSAKANASHPQYHDAPNTPLNNQPLGPVQNMSLVHSQYKPNSGQFMKASNQHHQPPQELFPVWVGNLFYTVTESMISNLFSRVGAVVSVKLLSARRCAFVNYTKQEYCDEAIHLFHGYELNGNKIAVRYPDRIPQGMGFSRSALKADDSQDENLTQNEFDGRNPYGFRGLVRPYRPTADNRGIHKN
ncbi:uncharacterized protein LOC142993130 isoform X2 [Genypterus blacodes]